MTKQEIKDFNQMLRNIARLGKLEPNPNGDGGYTRMVELGQVLEQTNAFTAKYRSKYANAKRRR